MLDRDRILDLIDTAERYADRIEEYVPGERSAYIDDGLVQDATERALQVAIEALIDIAGLFVRGLRLGLPNDEAGLASLLVRGRVLDREQAHMLSELRAFRNVIVHRYVAIDDDLVFDHALRAPTDIRGLARAFRAGLVDHGAT